MKKILLPILLLLMWTIGFSANAQLAKNEEGAFLIGSKADLEAFAADETNVDKNVVLTADIEDVTSILFPGKSYSGIFDGAGFTLTLNLTDSTRANALFADLSGTVKNLKLKGYVLAAVKNSASMVVNASSSAAKISHCVSSVTIECTNVGDGSHGGLVGNDAKGMTIEYSVFSGRITTSSGATNCGGLVGWVGNGATLTLNSSLMIGDITELQASEYICRPNSGRISAKNSYAYNDLGNISVPNVTEVMPAQVLSGEICYKLNGDQQEIHYYQTLGTDLTPMPMSSSKQVYAIGEIRCDGTFISDNVTYSNENTAPIPQHVDEDGYCSVCGSLLPNHLEPNADGFYELGNAKEVVWFSDMVEAGNTTIKGLLKNDIDFTGVEHKPIGRSDARKFNGVFDGKGFRVKNINLETNANYQGFFGSLRGGTVVKNLIIDASCYISGNNYVGGITGSVQTDTGQPVQILNCINEATVVGVASASGFIGAGQSSYPVIEIKNCLNAGMVIGNPATAFVSWINKGGSTITDSYNIGEITGVEEFSKLGCFANLARFEPNTITLKNVYDVSATVDKGQGVAEGYDTYTAESGELCYVLNGTQADIQWYQKIGTDKYPVPYYIEGGQVYLSGDVNCDGTPLGTASYSNTKTTEIPPHDYIDGFCTNCGTPHPDYAEEVDGYRMIGNASQLYWFSRMVNEYGKGAWSAKLTADIDADDYSELITPIGNTSSTFRGHFDGQGHTISNLYINSTGNFVGLIGACGNGALIENVVLDETCILRGYECVALVGGTNQMTGTVTLRNLGNKGNVYASNVQAAGIFGGNTGGKSTLIIENCFSTGNIESGSDGAALVGWGGSNKSTIRDSWSCANVTGYSTGKNLYFARITGGTLENCYCTSSIEQQVALIMLDDVLSGKLCYKLNGDQTNIKWYQNIDNGKTDYEPVPFADGHAQVYPKGTIYCDGSIDYDNIAFTNKNDAVVPDHQYHEGFCSVCGQEDHDYGKFLPVIENPDYSTTGGWMSDGAGITIENTVAQHNKHIFDTYQAIGGLQPGVYRLRVQGFSRAGAYQDETLYPEGMLQDPATNLNSQFYAECGGMKVATFFMDIMEVQKDKPLNEGNNEVQNLAGKYIPNGTAAAAKYFAKGNYWNVPLYIAVTSDTLRIGVRNQIYNDGMWTCWDRWRIEYVGDDEASYALIASQQAEVAMDMSEVAAQDSLLAAYADAVAAIENATDKDEILALADIIARCPEQINLSARAYENYDKAVQEIIDFRNQRDDLNGDNTDILDDYLYSGEEPNEIYPNGSYDYIMENKFLSIEELEAEILFVQLLLENALKTSIETGTDITSLLTNPGFDQDNLWTGWTTEHASYNSSNNFSCNTGFTDISPVAGSWNNTFNVWQELVGLPNGIYELETQAFYRPGANGEGDYEGTERSLSDLYINNYYTPVRNIYSDIIDYADAVNGVNCRFNPDSDPEAPHNGEAVSSFDYDCAGLGYVPDGREATSFAFSGGRYGQKVYAVVTDGVVRVGIRGFGKVNGSVTLWNGFKLKYRGQDAATISEILDQYATRAEALELQHELYTYMFSLSHIRNIETLIGQARNATDVQEQLQLIQQINDEFQTISTRSADVYAKLNEIIYFIEDITEYMYDDEVMEQLYTYYDELSEVVVYGTYTDEEAEAKYQELMENPYMGGTVYVVGDVYSEDYENGEFPYQGLCPYYPLRKNAEGKWEGTVRLQDRSRRINGYARAGISFRRLNTSYKCATPNYNFITPADNTFGITTENGQDFQALNGEYRVILDIDAGTVTFEQLDSYNWPNQVYVTGTLVSKSGTSNRWQNNETAPLQHVGEGVYVGMVELMLDNSNPYCSFGIMTNRSTSDMVNYSTATRSSWTEARYGSAELYLEIESGVKQDSLVRGLDRTWRIASPGKYMIEFDMNHRTMTATLLQTKGTGTANNPFIISTIEDLRTMGDRLRANQMTYFKLDNDFDLQGLGWWPINSTFFGNSSTEVPNKWITLDGNGHVIKNFKPTVHPENVWETGFFGTLCGTVKNIGFYNAEIDAQQALSVGVLAANVGHETFVKDGVQQTATVTDSYFTGTINAAQGNAGGVVGAVAGKSSLMNLYSNVALTSNPIEGYAQGGILGMALQPVSLTHSYAAGSVQGTMAGGIVGNAQAEGSTFSNLVVWNKDVVTDADNAFGTASDASDILYFNQTLLNGSAVEGKEQNELCAIVSAWSGWHEDGTIGYGYPLLQWQVSRGDYLELCGFGGADGIESIQGNASFFASFDANETVTVYNAAGQSVYRGRAAGMNLRGGLYLIKGENKTQKLWVK